MMDLVHTLINYPADAWQHFLATHRHPYLFLYVNSVWWTFVARLFDDIIMEPPDYPMPWEFRLLSAFNASLIPPFNVFYLILAVYSMIYKIDCHFKAKSAQRTLDWYDEQDRKAAAAQAKQPPMEFPIIEPTEAGFDPVTGAFWDPVAKTWADPELVDEAIHRKYKGPREFGNFKKRGQQ